MNALTYMLPLLLAAGLMNIAQTPPPPLKAQERPLPALCGAAPSPTPQAPRTPGYCQPYAEHCPSCSDCSQCGHCAGKGGKCSVCWNK